MTTPRQTGSPLETWPQGLWLCPRTGEVVFITEQFSRPIVQRGYAGSVETEAWPDDLWHAIRPKR